MANEATSPISIAYEHAAAEFANGLSRTLDSVGAGSVRATEQPAEAHLGPAEVVITILVTTVARAIIRVAINEIELYLEDHLSEPVDVQLVVKQSEGGPALRRFPLRLRSITREVVKEVFEKIRAVVDTF